jgi:hypothetical protein
MTGPDPGFETAARWFGPEERPLLGWLSTPAGGMDAGGSGGDGVLVLPAIGYAYTTSHRTLRRAAERLAAAGHTVLRIDYDGTGDSAGDQWDDGRVAAWERSVAAGVAELRALGCERLTILGVQLGAALALRYAAGTAATGPGTAPTGPGGAPERIVAWAPTLQGRRLARELKMFAGEAPTDAAALPEGAVVSAGNVFLAETLDQLGAIKVPAAPDPAPAVVVVDAVEKAEPAAGHLEEAGWAASAAAAGDGADALEVPTEFATVPPETLAAILDAVGPPAAIDAAGPPAADPRAAASASRPQAGPAVGSHPPAGASDRRAPAPVEPRSTATFDWHGTEVEEEAVTIGPHRMVGIATRLAGAARSDHPIVFLSPGSEAHIGPARAWVEYARGLAVAGRESIRVDFQGWGESPDGGATFGRPYDPSVGDDTVELVGALAGEGREPVLAGLCAGAWPALRAVLDQPVAGVIAFGPELYYQPGDRVTPRPEERVAAREPHWPGEERGRKLGLWSALDALGVRPPAGRWVEELRQRGRPVLLLFAPDDVALKYVRDRIARRVARAESGGDLRLRVVADLDHGMHRTWRRGAVLAELVAFLDDSFGPPAPAPADPSRISAAGG